MEHTLFVPDNNVGRAKFDEAFKTVIPVDNAAVKIVKIGGREASAIKWNERTDIRWKDWNNVQDHPFRTRAGFEEGIKELKTLDELFTFGF